MGRIWSSNCDGDRSARFVMGEIATNFGVESTARGAHDRGYELVFAEDAMTSVSPEVHGFVVSNIFPRMGWIRSTEQVLAAIGSVTR